LFRPAILACLVGLGGSTLEPPVPFALWRSAVAFAKEPRQVASTPRAKVDVSTLGPQVGARVPDFSLKDQNGKTQTLQSIMGPRGAMLVFIRSADW
jgi:hypothetical protein